MSFGEKIKKLRENKGLTQKELAITIGTFSKTIINYEENNLRPQKMEVYKKLADIFEINVNYFLTDEEYFIINSAEYFGYKGAKDAQTLVNSMTGFFAGGKLPQEDRVALFGAIQEAFWKSKIENKKYGRRKKIRQVN